MNSLIKQPVACCFSLANSLEKVNIKIENAAYTKMLPCITVLAVFDYFSLTKPQLKEYLDSKFF